jgi:Kef-type K+ transport system membrane component KefB/nucleotide-binding universal stress UspA family protein
MSLGKSGTISFRQVGQLFAPALALLVLASTVALAADDGATHQTGSSEALFLCQIILFMVFGRLLGEAMLRIGQPAVMGQLIAGILLGPSVLGTVWPDLQHAIFPPDHEQKAMIDAVAQLGILMLLLLAGMETDLSLVRKLRRTALSVSLTGIAIPFACGFILGEMLPGMMFPHPEQRLITSLFLGTALSISSVKIVAAVVREMNFLRRTVGQLIVTSAVIDDTVCWVIIAVTFGLALKGRIDLTTLAQSVLGTALFMVASFSLGRRLVFFLIRWSNDHFVSEVPVITTILAVMGGMALITDAIGVHTVLGAFVAGILIGQSPILTRHIEEQLRGLITALFMPVFFGLAGLSADLRVLASPPLLLLSLGFIAIASIGKFSGAFLGGAFSGLTWAESFALGWGMNARGSTEIIVASLGLSMGALSESLFTMIVAMAVVTTMAMPPMLRWALARLPLRAEEKARLEREEFEARGFVTNVERLLVAVDESDNGRFAARLTGLVAGSRRIPSTILPLGSAGLAESLTEKSLEVEAVVREAAGAAQIESGKPYDPQSGIDVTTRVPKETAEGAVAEEKRKGYDLLIIGVDHTVADDGIEENVTSIAKAFEGPFAVAAARGQHRTQPAGASPLNILVPVTGTRHSQRGVEVALVLARASLGSVTALHVARRRRLTRRQRLHRLRAAWGGLLENQEEILQDVVRLGDQFGVPVRTAVSTQGLAETAILFKLSTSDHNLVVLGVSPRPGSALFLGETATAILARSDRSVLLVAS